MKSAQRIAAWALLVWLLIVGVAGTAAQDSEPFKVIPVRVGPYPLLVNYYSEPRGGQALVFGIVPEKPDVAGLTYKVVAVPGTTTSATPVQAKLKPDPDRPNGVIGRVNLPVSGQWTLDITVEEPQGQTYGSQVPVLAGAPPAIPFWLGWLVGLVPLWAILAVVAVSARHSRAADYAPA